MLAKTIYGVEYNPQPSDDRSGGLGWIVVAVVVISLISLTWVLISRYRSRNEIDQQLEPQQIAAAQAPKPVEEVKPVEPPEPPPKPIATSVLKRPQKVQVLLQRLEEAQRRRDLELELSTIELLRALPGAPAADLDDHLARRLGVLNVKRLFEKKSRVWVKEVIVKSGESASRIAAENGSTIASFSKLNGGKIDRLIVGRKVFVFDHPRFQLVLHRRLMTADLMLNGKFFKRYDLRRAPTAKEGAYEIPAQVRPFWARLGVDFSAADRGEIELLMPKGSPVLISEM